MIAGPIPPWRHRVLVHSRIPAPLRPWVYEPHSLTRRLARLCGEEVTVGLLRHGWRRPFRDEPPLLGLGPQEKALVRQVRLQCGDRRLVFAHSVIPRATLTGPFRRLASLGTRPLADILFTSPAVVREAMEFARLTPALALHRLARQALDLPEGGELWCRRSRFRLRGHPLLVTEVFAPAIAEAPASRA